MHPNHAQFILDVLMRQRLASQAARHKTLGCISDDWLHDLCMFVLQNETNL